MRIQIEFLKDDADAGVHGHAGRIRVQGLAVDLTLYVLTMAGGFLLAARLSRSGPARRLTGVSLLAVMLYGAALVLFTFAAPPLGIFRS